jgi:hypothetical protein
VQAYLTANGGGTERFASGTAEFFGFRSFPVRPLDLYKEAAERELGGSWEDLRGTTELSLARRDPEHYPELAEAWERYQQHLRSRGSDIQAARDVAKEEKTRTFDQLNDLGVSIQWGRPGGGEFYKNQRPILLAESRRAFDIALADRGVNSADLPQSEAQDAILTSKLYELRLEDFLGPDNKPDWDAFFAERNRLLDQMTPTGRKAAEDARTFFPDHPELAKVEQRRIDAVDALQHWFDIPQYKGLTKEQSDEVDSLLEQASQVRELLLVRGLSYSRDDILKAIGAVTPGVDNRVLLTARVLTHSKIADLVRSPEAEQWTLAHPDMMTFYGFLFDTLSDEGKLEWQRLYSMRK